MQEEEHELEREGDPGGGEGKEEVGKREEAHLCWPKLDNDLSDWREASVASDTQRNCFANKGKMLWVGCGKYFNFFSSKELF